MRLSTGKGQPTIDGILFKISFVSIIYVTLLSLSFLFRTNSRERVTTLFNAIAILFSMMTERTRTTLLFSPTLCFYDMTSNVKNNFLSCLVILKRVYERVYKFHLSYQIPFPMVYKGVFDAHKPLKDSWARDRWDYGTFLVPYSHSQLTRFVQNGWRDSFILL